MKNIKNFVIGIAFTVLVFSNVNAETDITTQNVNPNSPISTRTVVVDNTTYVFNEIGTGIWQHVSSDIINVDKHTLTSYEYSANAKACATITPTVVNVRNNKDAFISACARIKTENTYLDTDTKYPIIEKKFINGKLVSQMQYLRDNLKRIKEARNYLYHNNGKVNRYTKYYAGKKINANSISYNKTYIINKDVKGKTVSIYNYELSSLWNEKKVNVATKVVKYKYYSNSKIKQRYTYLKSVKYNTYSKKQFLSYYSNGKKKQYILNNYDYKGKATKKYNFIYNKQGQLKSNKYGNAYRYTTTYKNGKKVKTYKYKYNAYGKAKRI